MQITVPDLFSSNQNKQNLQRISGKLSTEQHRASMKYYFSHILATSLFLASTLVYLVHGQNATLAGNCQTGRIYFDATRMVQLNGEKPTPVDVSKYDFYIEYGTNQASVIGGALQLTLSKNPTGGVAFGVRLSSTRYYPYAKISAMITVPVQKGVVSAFVTMSDRYVFFDMN